MTAVSAPHGPRIMGILNLTPDSFSDGGRQADPLEAGLAMLQAGADILDIGGESTRPGATPVPPAEEQRRILPAIGALARAGAHISVDTRNASTMAAALDAGAAIVNDVSGLQHDPASAALVASRRCPVILMHMRGVPHTMAAYAVYDDVVAETCREMAQRIATAEAAGIARRHITIDPGIGFAKTPAQSLALLRSLPALAILGLPILVGVSRKGFIGHYCGEPDPQRRLGGSLAAAMFAAGRGASILRVHDVAETAQALRLWQALTACAKESTALETRSAP